MTLFFYLSCGKIIAFFRILEKHLMGYVWESVSGGMENNKSSSWLSWHMQAAVEQVTTLGVR